jgi:hypothetical protein
MRKEEAKVGEHSVDWQAFQRLDNALVVDFLTSSASALCEKGLVSPKDTDNLRLVLSGIHSAPEARERSLLIELDKQNAEFLGLMTARFGTSFFCLNLLRHTLRGNLAETRKTIAEFGQALVKKSELLFNRPFHVFQSGRCQRQTLFSTVIIDFSEALAEACRLLDTALEALALMNPSDMTPATPADQEVDLAIAKALGFKGLVAHSLPAHTEAEAKRNVAQALALVADAASEISEQLTANTGAEAAYDVVAACEWLKAECQRLSFLELPQSESIMVWEVRRRNLSSCIQGINEALKLVASASLASLAHDQGIVQGRYPEAVKRRIAFDLIAAGQAPAKATEATQALFDYLQKNQLTPAQLLVGELTRIHPSLMPRSLETLVSLGQSSGLTPHATSEKTTTMARAKRLAAVFVAATTLMGCGLKTRPKSDILELRPDIPFRVDSAPKDKETSALPPGGPGSDVTVKKP